MPADADFLAAIATTPLDALPKLVYADWLDEHDDPRGELLRLDAELLATPPADDRYWHLHARRDALTPSVDADWLVAVRVGNDCAPVLAHGWPDDVTGRWRTVRAAAERLLGRSLGDVGGSADQVRWVEQKLGVALSSSLREWVAFTGETASLECYDDPFMYGFAEPPEWSADRGLLLLGGHRRGWYPMAIRADRLGDADPAVFEYQDDESGGWELRDSRSYSAVSEFALFRLWDDRHGTGGQLHADLTTEEAADLFRHLAGAFPPPSAFDGVRVYERPGVVVQVNRGAERTVRVSVSTQAGVTPADIPAFLFDIGCRGRHVGGVFVPELYRKAESSSDRRPFCMWDDNAGTVAFRRGVQSCVPGLPEWDAAEAVRWFRIAADAGHAEAMTRLADCYADGVGVAADAEQMRAWYERAAERGDGWAAYRLGKAYRTGRGGLATDPAAAADCFRTAVAAGSMWAINELGMLYDHGRGVPQDAAEAVRLYTRAAELGDEIACGNAGYAYFCGRGVPADFAVALEWYRKGAELGDEPSKKKLAELEAG